MTTEEQIEELTSIVVFGSRANTVHLLNQGLTG